MDGPGNATWAWASRLVSGLMWLASVLLVGAVSVVVISSLTALIFAGPLERFLPIGLAAGLVGALVVNLCIGLVARNGVLVALPAAATTVILSILLADLAADMGEVADEVLAASLALTLAGAAFVTGLLFFLAGTFRIGEFARFVPYPVFAGFLGALGILIVRGGLELAAQPADALLTDFAAMAYWVPALVLGAALLAATQQWTARLLLPIAIICAVAVFHFGRLMLGIEIGAAAEMGLLLASSETAALRPIQIFEIAQHADVRAVAGTWPTLAVLALIALVAAALSAAGIELSTEREVHFDRDLRTIGFGNLIASLGGGLAAFHNVGSTTLLYRLLGGAAGRAGLGVALVLAMVLAGGMELLAMLPRTVLAAVLVYLGLELIERWVLAARRRMPASDFAVLLGIVAVGVAVGFLEAVAAGMVAAIGLFIVNYSRVDFIRSAPDGSLRQSTTERGEADRQAIIAKGTGVRIFDLQGYVFFGAAQRLMRRLSGEVSGDGAPIRAIILDFRHTQGVDVSAAVALAGLAKRCSAQGVRLWLTDTAPGLDAMIRRADPAAVFLVAPNLDVALATEEDDLLSRLPAREPPSALAILMSRIEAEGHGDLFGRQKVAAGTVVYRQGEPSETLVLLEEGSMSARVGTSDGGELQVATILPGALIGEIGFFGDVPRTASVVADSDSVLRVIHHAALDELARRAPELSEAFLRCGAALMAHRLARTNALLRHLHR